MKERTILAQSLRRHLLVLGHDVGQGHMLAALARAAGYADDNALNAAQRGGLGTMRLDCSPLPAVQASLPGSSLPGGGFQGKMDLLFPPVGPWTFPPPGAPGLLRISSFDPGDEGRRALWNASRDHVTALLARVKPPQGEDAGVLDAASGAVIWAMLLTAMAGRDPTVLALLADSRRTFSSRKLRYADPELSETDAGRLFASAGWSIDHRRVDVGALHDRIKWLLSGSDPATHGDLEAFFNSLPVERVSRPLPAETRDDLDLVVGLDIPEMDPAGLEDLEQVRPWVDAVMRRVSLQPRDPAGVRMHDAVGQLLSVLVAACLPLLPPPGDAPRPEQQLKQRAAALARLTKLAGLGSAELRAWFASRPQVSSFNAFESLLHAFGAQRLDMDAALDGVRAVMGEARATPDVSLDLKGFLERLPGQPPTDLTVLGSPVWLQEFDAAQELARGVFEQVLGGQSLTVPSAPLYAQVLGLLILGVRLVTPSTHQSRALVAASQMTPAGFGVWLERNGAQASPVYRQWMKMLEDDAFPFSKLNSVRKGCAALLQHADWDNVDASLDVFLSSLPVLSAPDVVALFGPAQVPLWATLLPLWLTDTGLSLDHVNPALVPPPPARGRWEQARLQAAAVTARFPHTDRADVQDTYALIGGFIWAMLLGAQGGPEDRTAGAGAVGVWLRLRDMDQDALTAWFDGQPDLDARWLFHGTVVSMQQVSYRQVGLFDSLHQVLSEADADAPTLVALMDSIQTPRLRH